MRTALIHVHPSWYNALAESLILAVGRASAERHESLLVALKHGFWLNAFVAVSNRLYMEFTCDGHSKIQRGCMIQSSEVYQGLGCPPAVIWVTIQQVSLP